MEQQGPSTGRVLRSSARTTQGLFVLAVPDMGGTGQGLPLLLTRDVAGVGAAGLLQLSRPLPRPSLPMSGQQGRSKEATLMGPCWRLGWTLGAASSFAQLAFVGRRARRTVHLSVPVAPDPGPADPNPRDPWRTCRTAAARNEASKSEGPLA